MSYEDELVLACSEDRSNHNDHERLHRLPVIARNYLQVKTITALAMAEIFVEIATYEGDGS